MKLPSSLRRLGVAALLTLACAIPPASAADMSTAKPGAAQFAVTLLGTGSPVPSAERFSQSILVEAGDKKLVFDLGRGVTIRLAQRGIRLGAIDASFLTHFHSDHTVGLVDLWQTGWLPTPFGSRTEPFVIYGPKGTAAMTDNLTKAFSEDIRIRIADEKLPPRGIAFDAHDIGPGVVYDKDGVRVTAFETHHGDLIEPNYGYTVEYLGRKVVISSDTTYDDRIAKRAAGADLLIHEVADIDAKLLAAYPRFKEIIAHHSSPEDAARIFSMAKPKLAAYTHIIVLRANQQGEPDTSSIRTRTRAGYGGPLAIGEDLMRFEIGDTVKVTDARGHAVDTTTP